MEVDDAVVQQELEALLGSEQEQQADGEDEEEVVLL
jgi:hypothetical protein